MSSFHDWIVNERFVIYSVGRGCAESDYTVLKVMGVSITDAAGASAAIAVPVVMDRYMTKIRIALAICASPVM